MKCCLRNSDLHGFWEKNSGMLAWKLARIPGWQHGPNKAASMTGILNCGNRFAEYREYLVVGRHIRPKPPDRRRGGRHHLGGPGSAGASNPRPSGLWMGMPRPGLTWVVLPAREVGGSSGHCIDSWKLGEGWQTNTRYVAGK